MASKTTYTCDECKKKIGTLYGPLRVQVRADIEPLFEEGEFCDVECAAAWIRKLPK